MISGSHVIVYSRDAEADRSFFRDVLRLPSVDAGGGWLTTSSVHEDHSFDFSGSGHGKRFSGRGGVTPEHAGAAGCDDD